MKRITVYVNTKDRSTEIALLLQSLRTQQYKCWDLIILDESEQPIMNQYFIQLLVNQIKLENHYVRYHHNTLRLGVCHARNMIISLDYFDNPLSLRLDDDVIIESDYLTKLSHVISKGYDIASGVTPLIGRPTIKRHISHVMPIINRKKFDKFGNIISYGDDCGHKYIENKIIPANEFRSCALMKKVVVDKIGYENNLSPTGFREEAFFSLRAQWQHKFKIGVHTTAMAYHFASPAGGCRSGDYGQRVQSDNSYFYKWVKKMYKKFGDL